MKEGKVELGEWNDKGKLVFKSHKAETKVRENVYSLWMRDLVRNGWKE